MAREKSRQWDVKYRTVVQNRITWDEELTAEQIKEQYAAVGIEVLELAPVEYIKGGRKIDS